MTEAEISLGDLVDAASAIYDMPSVIITGPRKTARVSAVRTVIAHAARSLGFTSADTAAALLRHHTSVLSLQAKLIPHADVERLIDVARAVSRRRIADYLKRLAVPASPSKGDK